MRRENDLHLLRISALTVRSPTAEKADFNCSRRGATSSVIVRAVSEGVKLVVVEREAMETTDNNFFADLVAVAVQCWMEAVDTHEEKMARACKRTVIT